MTPTTGATASKTGVAVHVEGRQSDTIRRDLAAALGRDTQVVEEAAFDRALAEQGLALPLGALLRGAVRSELLVPLSRAAESVYAQAVVVGRVDGRSRITQTMRLIVVKSDAGELLSDTTVSLGALRRGEKRRSHSGSLDVRKAIQAIRRALARLDSSHDESSGPLQPVAATGVDDSPEVVSKVEVGGNASSRGKQNSVAELAAGVTLGGRRHAYKGVRSENLRPYNLEGAPGISLEGTVFPWAHDEESSLFVPVGLAAQYSRVVILDSGIDGIDGKPIQTSASRWQVGPRVRLQLSRVEVHTTVAIGGLSFTFNPPAGFEAADELPDVHYAYARVGADAFLRIGRLTLMLGGGYMHMLRSGQVGDVYFPRSRVFGLDARGGIGCDLAGGVAVRFQGRFTRISYDLNAKPESTYDADTALDRHYGAELALAHRF